MPIELITGAVVGVAVASPTVRRVVRRGVVYGLAGLLVAYDKVAKVTHAVVSEAKSDGEPAAKPSPGPEASASPASAQPNAQPASG